MSDPETEQDEHGQDVVKSTQSEPASKDVILFCVEVSLISAKDLERADFAGKSDPFCKVSAEGRSFSTQYIEKTLDPEWNEKTQFTFFKSLTEINFEVFDWDKGSKHDSIGTAVLDISKFFEKDHPGFSGNLSLLNVKTGSINVAVRGRKIELSELERRIEKMEAQTLDNNATLETQSQTIDTKKSELQTLTELNTQLTTQSNQCKSEITDIEKTIREKEANIQSFQNQIKDTQNSIQTIQQSNKEKSDGCDKLMSEKESLTENLHKSESESETLDADMRKWKDTLQEKEYNVGAATAELEGGGKVGSLTDPLLA